MPRPLTVLFEDERLLAVHKPPRMLTVAAPRGEAQEKGSPLIERLRQEGHRVLAVHRIDYETSGVVLFAKDDEMREALMDLFKRREVRKSYLLLVLGRPRPPRGRIDLPIKDLGASAAIAADGSPAITHYETLETVGPCTLLRAHPETGRHNQIRLHFARIGHPLVGERKFAVGRDAVLRHKRVLLHAESLEFRPPHLEREIRIVAPLPEDFLNALGKSREAPDEPPRPREKAARRPDHRGGARRGAHPGRPGKLRRGKGRR